jgi:putative transcriptional regulator
MAAEQTPLSPMPEEIIALRKSAGLTQTKAAGLVYYNLRSWQQFEAREGTKSHRKMHPSVWELFNIKVQNLLNNADIKQEF